MNGFKFRATALTFTLLSTAFLPSLTSATSASDDSNKTKIYRTKLGCMACHQGESIQTDKAPKKNQDNLQRQNKVPTVQAD